MKKTLLLLMAAAIYVPSALAGDFLGIFPRHTGVEPVTNKLYSESCGECHFAYQPGLLPARSWQKLMEPKSLEDHFGENAEMSEKDRVAVLEFLTQYSADSTIRYKRSIKIRRSIPDGETPIRITEVPYIKKKHEDIPRQMVQDNRKVRSLSYCNRCHTQAAKGIFQEDTVDIPNFRDWKDLID